MSSSSKDTTRVMSMDEYLAFVIIPFEEIEAATNNFSDENLVTQGSSCKVYKGQLLDEESGDLIDIVVRKHLQRNTFFNELILCKYLEHKNIVSVFKFTWSDEAEEGFTTNKYEANGSLDQHLSDTALINWMRRLDICVGVALALKYLHYDAQLDVNHYVIHGNIKSSKVLLDHNWEPKLHGFGFYIRAKKHHLHLTSKYNGSLLYMDPAYENTGGLTYKSDVFSFGVLLFEVLFGREASIQNNDNWYFARLARSHYKEGKLDDLIDPDLRKQMNSQSLNIFAEAAYYCLNEQRSQRPDMNQVLSKLEKALGLQREHEYPTAVAVESTPSNHLKLMLQGENLNHLRFRLSDIKLATNNFSESCCIGSGGFGQVYKAELEHFDDINSSVVEGKNKGVLPKKHGNVAIKRISSRVDELGEQGFFAEIEMLSKCRHPNIVSLLGFCDEGEEMILVYEYVSKGSLDDYLGNVDNMTNLTWGQRVQICLDIAHGLLYLHTSTHDKQCIIHRDIKSANILLDDNWVAKIADFGLSKLHCANQQGSTLVTNNIAGTEVYLDPEYMITGKLKTKSDIYSFGVVMFEIMCGRLAYDKAYNEKRLPSIARQCFNDGTMKNIVDPKIKETDDNISMLIGGVNYEDSLDMFSKLAYQCLAKTQSERPTIEAIIKELVNALNSQKTSKSNLHMSLKTIKLATHNFNDCNCIGKGRFWKLYEGEVPHADGCTHNIVAKRWDREPLQAHMQFFTELDFLVQYKHENIVALAGYCNEMDEKIIVYENASNGNLNKHLCNPSLTWMKRLQISLDVASGLEFIHKGGRVSPDAMRHGDMKSDSILLDGDWNAKISNFELSCKTMGYDTTEHLRDNDYHSLGYLDPKYQIVGFLTKGSDIYSLGVILFEMLCGRVAWGEGCKDHFESLGPLAVRHYNEKGNLDEMIYEGIKEQIVPQSLTTFVDIALQSLKDKWDDRPTACEVVIQLKKALEFQEDYEIWEPKLPIDYKEIMGMSEISNSTKTQKNLYDIFSNGILLQDNKLMFSLGSNGERNEMISARKFLYKNHTSHKWRSVSESRFPKVLKMLDSSNMKIQIKIRTQFLSPCVNYKVLLIFRFSSPRKSQAKRMYVNLKYKMGNESLHAYYATWREDGWMMIELFRFLSRRKDTDFEVLLESFSLCYCGRHSVYIEGIQFQATDNVKHEEIDKLKETQLLSKDEMLSAKDVVRPKSCNMAIHPSGAIEFPRQQVFRIKCIIRRQVLSSNKENVCYLVFKLSNKFCGLHGPVIVRNLFHRRSKETGILYFRTPNSWNLHDTDWIPEKRKDGWMEVILWKFNSNYKLGNDHLVHLKLVTYEGTMAGLIIRNIEFR